MIFFKIQIMVDESSPQNANFCFNLFFSLENL